jgi:hypothetical protein
MSYETYFTPSFDMEWATKQKSSYECEHCGIQLEDHETFLRGGKTYCGCCK